MNIYPPGVPPAVQTQRYVTSLILSLLQELLEKGCSPSMLKVYVAAIAAPIAYAPIDGQSVGRKNLVVRFLKGSRRLNPLCPFTVLTWNLPRVLRALKSRYSLLTFVP